MPISTFERWSTVLGYGVSRNRSRREVRVNAARVIKDMVKARADAWVAAGETDLADEIFKRRSNVVKKINALELGVFAMQTNDKKKMVSPDELQALRKDSIVAVDAVLEKMYCQLKEDGSERRWRSGACEKRGAGQLTR